MLNNNNKISPKTYKKLAQYSRHIDVVADKSKPITQTRRVILQNGKDKKSFYSM